MYAGGDADTFLFFLLDPSIQAPVLTLAGQLGSLVVDELLPPHQDLAVPAPPGSLQGSWPVGVSRLKKHRQ